MIVVSAIAALRDAVAEARAGGARIGFVPTMGALHNGHMSLVDRSRKECEVTVMSIFVNPLQFSPGEDLARYPRPTAEDERLAAERGVDILFRPEVGDMYPPGRTITVTGGALVADWEGKSRPGHFDGVLTVVAKLFNIVRPDVAIFGRKDLQQAALVKALVKDLDMPVSIILAPIVRESDGLALSSRNRFLGTEHRQHATVLSKALACIRLVYAGGERDVAALEAAGRRILSVEPEVSPDYLAIVNPLSFARSKTAQSADVAIVAARVGTTRLIDNMTLGDDRD